MRRWRNFIIIALLFLSVCVLTATVVSAAQGSLPGDRVYQIKLTLERLRLGLASDDVARARLHLEFLETRLNELDQVIDTPNAMLALETLNAALADATRAVATLPAEEQGDMRAQLARLALRAADALARWQMAGGDDPRLDHLLKLARAIGEAAANPNTSVASLLLLLDQLPATGPESAPIQIAARGVQLPADLVAAHQPPFSGRHAEIACSTCHLGGKVEGMSAICTTCHEDPHLGKFERLGHNCTACHTDVAFQPSTFDHVRFPDCQTCHRVDAPQDHYPGQCSNCHTESAWTPADFNHTGFTDCVSCHTQNAPTNHYPGQCSNCHTTTAWTPANFSHTGFTDCVACHSRVAPANHYPGQCGNCHNTNAWLPASFNHAGFTDCVACHSRVAPANHYPGQCGNCHNTNAWTPASFNHSGFTDCAACHSNRAPANHYAGQCSNCHNTNAWTPASFNHSGFTDCAACHSNRAPVNHYSGQCSSCHNTSSWGSVNFNHAGFTDCASCHARPPNHFQGQCSDCHNTNTWGDATFNHGFPLNHGNANRQCAACHPGGNTGSWSCTGCHSQRDMDEHHKEVSGYSGNCLACHANGRKPKD